MSTPKNYKVFLIYLIPILLIFIAFTSFSHLKMEVAIADNIPTISDITNQLENNGVNLITYVNDFYSPRANIPRNDLAGSYPIGSTFGNNTLVGNGLFPFETVYGDDNIVNFIPKSYFCTEMSKLYIGNAYGFAIKTTSVCNNIPYYFSSVILLRNESNWYGDVYKFKLSVLAKMDFCYVTPTNNNSTCVTMYNSDGTTHYEQLYVSVISNVGCVAPVARIVGFDALGRIMQIVESNNISLANLSISTNTYNQNELNAWNVGYSANNDDGYFLVGNNYNYHITEHASGNNHPTIAQLINSVGSFALGALLDITGLDALNSLLEATSLVVSIADSFQPQTNSTLTNVTNISCGTDLTNTIWTTRADQITNFGHLIKTSNLLFGTGDHSLWYEKDDYIETLLTFSHTNGIYNYTRTDINIAAYIIDNTSNSNNVYAVLNELDLYTEKNAPAATAITINEAKPFYMTPFANKQFTFTPSFSGDYVLNVNGSVGNVMLDGNIITGSNGTYALNNLASGAHTITLCNNGATCTGSVTMGVSSGATTIAPNQQKLVKYTLATTGLWTWNTSDPDVVVVGLYMANNGALSAYSLLNLCSINNVLDNTLPAAANDYYVLLQSNKATDTTVTVSPTQPAAIGVEATAYQTLQSNYRFVKFVAPYSDLFTLYVDKTDGQAPVCNCLVFDASLTSVRSQTSDVMSLLTQSTGTVLYIAVACPATNGTTGRLRIKRLSDAAYWLIDNQVVSPYTTLARNNTYSIQFFYEGDNAYALSIIVPQNGSNVFTLDGNNNLTVSATAPINSVEYEFQAQRDELSMYLYTLHITIAEDDKLTLTSVNNSNGAGFKVYVGKAGITALNYSLLEENNTVITTGSMNVSVGNSYPISIVNATTTRMTTLAITSVTLNNTSTTYLPTVATDSWFGGGQGTSADPIKISAVRHFNNIRKNNTTSAYFKQMADLNFGGYPTARGVNFYGHYNGNLKSISGIEVIESTDPSNVVGGMFDKNYGEINSILSYTATVMVGAIQTAHVVGGVVGSNESGGYINMLFVYTSVQCTSKNSGCASGGIVGRNYGTVGVAFADNIQLSGKGTMGGVVGINYSSGTVNANILSCSISYTRNSSNLTPKIGGMIGQNLGTANLVTEYTDIDIVCNNVAGTLNTYRPCIGILVGYQSNAGYLSYDSTWSGSIDTGNLPTACLVYVQEAPVGRYN